MKQKNSAGYKLAINPKLYPISAIYGAAYVFIDKVYIRLDGDPNKKIEVHFKAKAGITQEDLKELIGQFENELLNYSLRERIIKSNQKVREYVIAQALLSPLYEFSDLAAKAASEEYLDDPLGIAKTWEERFGKKKAKK